MIVIGAAKSYYLDSQDRALDTGAICTYIYDSEHNQWAQDGTCMFEEKYGNLGFAIDISNYMSYSGQIPIRHLKMIAGNPHYSDE